MKGDPKVIAHLNKVLRNELTAINQVLISQIRQKAKIDIKA